MADDFFGKGIPLTSGFDLSAKSPLDSRLVANTLQERDDNVKFNRAYVGMRVYVISELKEYVYTGSAWKEILNEDSDLKIDLSAYATTEFVEESLTTKAPFEHIHEQYLLEIPMEYVEDMDFSQVETDLGKLATKNDILNHKHDDLYVLKEDMHEPPNFTYFINMIGFDEEPLVTVEGDYPDLSIMLNIPGFSGSYEDLTEKPTIPERFSQLEDDLGLVRIGDLDDFITDADLSNYVTFEALEQMDFATVSYVDNQIATHEHMVISDNELNEIVENI
jgi:hypothetical protein